jgi:hypothetical protein
MNASTAILCAALLLGPVSAFAQSAKDTVTSKASASNTMSVSGTVSSISADSVTIKSKSGEWTFAVDQDTRVTSRGSSTKTTSSKANGKASVSDFVRVGDTVTVRYSDIGDKKHAAMVSVRAAGSGPDTSHSACREETCSKSDCKRKCDEKPCACSKT